MLPAAEDTRYERAAEDEPQAHASTSRLLHLATACIGVAVGAAGMYYFLGRSRYTDTPVNAHTRRSLLLLTTLPMPCDGWEARCRTGAAAAAAKGHARFWAPALCDDGAKLSCKFLSHRCYFDFCLLTGCKNFMQFVVVDVLFARGFLLSSAD